jgi:hypothetical protein
MNTLISRFPAIWQLPLITRLRSRPIISLIGVASLLLALVFGVIALVSGGSHTAATHEVVNQAGQYRFEVPDGWSTSQQGRTTTVISPDQATVITLGVSGPGSLPVAGTLFFQQVARNYRNVQVIPPQAKQVGPRTALVYGGIGDNEHNVHIRFLAITVENKPDNYGIAVFTAANSDPNVVLPSVNRIVDSFRPLPAG